MKKLALLFALALVAYVVVLGLSVHESRERTLSDDPGVWEAEIAAFEAADRQQPPPDGAILFVGSSSIRLWQSLAADMAPLPVIQRGFGGARIRDLAHYADRLITPYQARAVVMYIGSNDLNVAQQPRLVVPEIEAGLYSILATIRATQPDVDVFFIGITPAIVLGEHLQAVRAANEAAAAVMATDPRAHFILTEDLFIDADGEIEKKLFQYDGLHLSREGYELWAGRIRPLLEALEDDRG